MKTNKDNPETLLATLGKQDTWWRQTRTIRRHYWQHWENKTHDEDKQGQSGDTTGNIGKTRHMMKTNKDNPETLQATLGKQDIGWRQTRTIRRHNWQHWENKTQYEDKQGQSGDTTGNIGKTRHRMKTKKTNPETQLATLGKQETGWRQTRTIRRHYWQHWENRTQDEDKQGQSKDTTGNIGKTRNRMKTNKDNPETQLATLGKQNTGWRQTRTIRRHYWQHWENKKQDEDRQGQSEDTTDNIGKTRHMIKTYMDNPETLLATLGKQDTGWRQTRTIRRHNWQHWENKTQDEDIHWQSGDTTGNIGKTRHMMKTDKDNPKTQLTTLGKQDTGWRHTWTIRRNYWQHWENKTQDEDRQ